LHAPHISGEYSIGSIRLSKMLITLLFKQDGDNTYWPVPDDIITKIEDNYGINTFDYYTAACDCAINGSGEVDPAALPSEDGKPPQCFYNIGCQNAEACLELNDEWSICWPMDFE
jgi:hypothetical protein